MKSYAKSKELQTSLKILEAWAEEKISRLRLPGMAAGIVYDKELIWAKGFRFADIERQKPATPKTIYRIASISKTFTATAIMQLRDRGLLQLDDPVSKHLMWFKFKNRFSDTPTITIRHLLTHTSGLPRESPFSYWNDYNFPTREEMIECLQKQENAYPAETRFKYSNLALAIAGEVVAKVAKQPYEKYIQENIFDPLKMASSSVNLPKSHMERLAVPYDRPKADGLREILPFTDSKGITPAANLSSTVEDLGRYISFHLSDGKVGKNTVLKSSTLREMHRIHWLYPSWKQGWGLGIRIYRDGERTLCGHGGSVSGYRTKILFAPAEKVGVICLTNSEDADPYTWGDQMMRMMAPTLASVCAPPLSRFKADSSWKKYTGTFHNSWGEVHVLFHKDDLVLMDPSYENPFDSLMKLIPVAKDVFRMEGEDGQMSIGEKAVFDMGRDGKPKSLRIGATYHYPVKP